MLGTGFSAFGGFGREDVLHELRHYWLELGKVEASQIDTLLVAVGRNNCVSCSYSVDLCTHLLCFCLHGVPTGLDGSQEGGVVKIMRWASAPLSLSIF